MKVGDLVKFKFPLFFSKFKRKRNAKYDGDPEGDYVEAEDINEVQESIERLEQIIGIEGLQETVISSLSNKADLSMIEDFGSPLFINYSGSSVNAYDSESERVSAFSYLPFIFIKKESAQTSDLFFKEVRRTGTALYGRIDGEYSKLNDIEHEIDWFKSKGFEGIFLDDFGYTEDITRQIQNQILDYAHKQEMQVVVTGEIDTTLLNKPHDNNPEQESLHLGDTDIYLFKDLFIIKNKKNDPQQVIDTVSSINKAQKELGIRVFVEDKMDFADNKNTSYVHGKMLATLFNIDGYTISPASGYALGEKVERFIHGFETGPWKDVNGIFVDGTTEISRALPKGTVVYDKVENKVFLRGAGLTPTLYTWEDKSIPGSAVDFSQADFDDAAVGNIVESINKENHKIHYSRIDGLNEDGLHPDAIRKEVIRSINISPAAKKLNPPDGYKEADNDYIHGGVIDFIDASAIKSGTLSIDAIKANVIEAINAYIGHAVIDSAFIGELEAEHITASVIDAINIYAENISAGNAIIDSAVIGELDAGHITVAVIDAINANIGSATINAAAIGELAAGNIEASVIEAINAKIGSALIDQAVIGDLKADKIAASVIEAINANLGTAKINKGIIAELDAGHISASVIEAINLFAKEAGIGHAVIDNAVIGDLGVDNIKANVVDAINAYIGSATIDNAVIGELDADNISANVVKAINLYAEEAGIDRAIINSALIGELKAENITAAVIDAINANIESAFIDGAIIDRGTIGNVQIADGSITDAKIVDLVANKITAGVINTGEVTLQGENSHLRIVGNKLQVFDNQTVPIERVVIGDVNNDGTMYGFRVRGKDGFTVLYDEQGVYSEGITDGAITNPKIAEGAVENRNIFANTITGDRLVVNAITAREIMAKTITANEIMAQSITAKEMAVGTITAASGIIGKGAIGEAEIGEAVINDAHIKSLNADKIDAGRISAQFLEIGPGTEFKKGYSPEELRAEMEGRTPFKLEIISTNGTSFQNGKIETTLIARIYKGGTDITDEILESQLNWSRVSNDEDMDKIWNAIHTGLKEVKITSTDVRRRATFLCELVGE